MNMSEESPSQPKRVRLSDDDLNSMSNEQLVEKLKGLDSYVDFLEERQRLTETGDESEELKVKLELARRKENTLVARLTNKEQEVQDLLSKNQELKLLHSSPYSGSGQLRSMQLDPAINLVFTSMQKEMDSLKEKLEQSQNELNAWKFTPDSQTGKKLMSKCRMLHQENEELGKVLSTGRISKLEGEIALEKQLVQDMKKGQNDLDEFLGEIDEDVEGMQGMVYMLQQQLKDTKQQLDQALEKLDSLNPGGDHKSRHGSSGGGTNDRTLGDIASTWNKPSENHIGQRTDSVPGATICDVVVKVEPMEVDSSDQWTTRTPTESSSLVNSTHSPPCNSSSPDHKPTAGRTNTPPSANDVSASGDTVAAQTRRKLRSDVKHEPSTTHNGVQKRSSLDALDE